MTKIFRLPSHLQHFLSRSSVLGNLYVYVYSTIVQHWLQLGMIYSCSLSKESVADPLHAQAPWLQIHHPSSVDVLLS